jgi:hypothetical protein
MEERGWVTADALRPLLRAHAASPEALAAELLRRAADPLALLRRLHIRRRSKRPARGSTAAVHFLLQQAPRAAALPLVLKLSLPSRRPGRAAALLAERFQLAAWQDALGDRWPARLALPGPLLLHQPPAPAAPRAGYLLLDRADCTLWDAAQTDAAPADAALWILQVLLLWAALLRLPSPACLHDPALTNFGLVRGRVHAFDFGMLALGRPAPGDPAQGSTTRLVALLRGRLDPARDDPRARDPAHALFHGFQPPPAEPPPDDALPGHPCLDRLALQLAAHLAAERRRGALRCAPLQHLADRALPWPQAQALLRFANEAAPGAYPSLYEATFCRRAHLHPHPPWGDTSWRRLRDLALGLAGGADAAADALRARHADLLAELPPLLPLLTR